MKPFLSSCARHRQRAPWRPLHRSGSRRSRGAVRDVGRVRQSAEALVAHPVEQLVLHLLVGQVVQTLEHQDPHHRLGRYGGRPPCALTGRGATLSTSAANDAKSMCDSISASGSPSASIFLRWCSSANRSVLMALRGFIGAGCGVQGVVILPKAGEAEVFEVPYQMKVMKGITTRWFATELPTL